MCCLEEKNNENAVVQESAPAQQKLGSHMGREPGETGGQQASQHNASARESDGNRAPAQQELGSHMGREPGETGGQQVSQHNASARESDGDRAPELSLPDLSNGPGMLLD